jgi:NAD(P)-dependent dehydrogenase (short-subunit alcohol dehydrogenase family)
MSEQKVALVTGASRGVGAGIARALGSLGYVVYITGRSEHSSSAIAWDGSPLGGTINDTAAAVTAAGGQGIALVCDHSDDSQVAKVFETIKQNHGRLDMLINNATHIHPQLIEPKPFWEKELAAQNILNVGLRSAYVASWHAAQIMVPQQHGFIGFVSSFGASCYMHGPGYGAQKAGIDKLAHDMAHDFEGTGVIAVSLWLGPQLTERAKIAAQTNPEQYTDFIAAAENPEFPGYIFDALDRAENRLAYSGETLIGAEVAKALGITDNGHDRPSYREMLGSPRVKNPAKVY